MKKILTVLMAVALLIGSAPKAQGALVTVYMDPGQVCSISNMCDWTIDLSPAQIIGDFPVGSPGYYQYNCTSGFWNYVPGWLAPILWDIMWFFNIVTVPPLTCYVHIDTNGWPY